MKKHLPPLALTLSLLFVTSCGPAFDAGLGLPLADENENGIVVYEAVDITGKLLEKTVLKAPTELADDSNQQKAKSAVQVIDGSASVPHIGVVFIGDGYAANDMNQYNQDVTAILKKLELQEPFKSYRRYFTFYRVDYIAPQSGIGKTASKGLGMQYNCNNIPHLLCINTTRALQEAQQAARSDIVFAIANSAEYGGAGYRRPSVSTLAARHPAALELALHEVGHSFAELGDEYEDAGINTNCNTYPNISQFNFSEMAKRKTKWYRWQDLSHVSSFAGACYSSQFYRPTVDSKMRTLGNGFGEVNLEQFIIQIYKRLKPILFATGSGTIRSHGTIEVQPMQPSSHSLSITWSLDGKILPALQNKTKIETRDLLLPKSTHVLTATVLDNTPAVRDETFRQQYMQQTVKWTLRL